ncbi:MAG TPA: hypothetical protein VI731_12075 [Bacteroidia bacterium]|nr:hypothetical protein [Bacteroidia bacterium]
MKKLLFILLAALPALFSSCRKGSPSWETGLLFPIAYGSISIDNLITDSLITEGADGSVRLVYSTKIAGLTDSLFEIPDTSIINSYNIPFGSVIFNPGDWITPTNNPTQTTYALGNVELVMGILSEGIITLQLKNDIRRRVILNYEIPCASINGDPFDTSFVVNAAPDSLNASYLTAVIDLSGYTFSFTGTNNNMVNTITTIFSARIDPTETLPVTVYNTDSVAAINTFGGIKPYYIRGYFGSETTMAGPEETGMSFFNRVQSGAIGLDSLTMNLRLTNYIGMDARITVNSLWSRNTRTGQSVYMNNSMIGAPINVDRATYATGTPPSNPSVYNFSFNNANSNAKALVENMPDKLGYAISILTNPLGNVSGNNDFFFANYGIDAQLDVELPLNFYADQLVFEDTMEMSFASVENKEKILRGHLTLLASNSFPFTAGLQVFLMDANNQVLDSIIPLPGIINSGATMSVNNYIVSAGFSNTQIHIPLNESQTQALLNSTRLIFRATFDTNSAPGYVKIYSTNRLDLQLTADFDYFIGD